MDYKLKELREEMNKAKAKFEYYENREDTDSVWLDVLRESMNEEQSAFFAHLKEKKQAKKELQTRSL